MIPVIFVVFGVMFKFSQKYFKANQGLTGELNGAVEEVYSNQKIVSSYNVISQEQKNFEEKNEKLYRASKNSTIASSMIMPAFSFIYNLGYLAVLIGSVAIFTFPTNITLLTAFLVFIPLFNQPLLQVGQSMNSIQTALASGERILDFLDEKEEEDEKTKPNFNIKNLKGDISFKNVKFGYNENKIIIHNFSIDIKAGSKVAIVGKTGAGKTTIVNLLMRFYDLNSGCILIDKKNIYDYKRESTRNLFSMVLQDS
jgi:ATP-binding cassette subfamily B protein